MDISVLLNCSAQLLTEDFANKLGKPCAGFYIDYFEFNGKKMYFKNPQLMEIYFVEDNYYTVNKEIGFVFFESSFVTAIMITPEIFTCYYENFLKIDDNKLNKKEQEFKKHLFDAIRS